MNVNKKKEALDKFLSSNDEKIEEIENKVTLIEEKRTGLIERVDKIFIVNDGRQLLREQY